MFDENGKIDKKGRRERENKIEDRDFGDGHQYKAISKWHFCDHV
jgi:hypothetical protein